MKIAVIGAGAIGSLVAGYLKKAGSDVVLVSRSYAAGDIIEKGLRISGVWGESTFSVYVVDKLQEKPDVAILAVKTQDVEEALKNNLEFLKDTCVMTTQNGIQADTMCSNYIPKENIVSSIVMFGSTCLKPGRIVHNFEGDWIIGKRFTKNDETIEKLQEIFAKSFNVVVSDNVAGMKYTKVFINANNCVPAIVGVSMQEVFSDVEMSRIGIAIWREGLEVVRQAGIQLESLPSFPVGRLTKLTSMPLEAAAKVFSEIMVNLSKDPLYGSILQSIKRGKPSEIDYINGEFVAIAQQNNISAPLNEKLVAMVHEVERSCTFFSKKGLIAATREFTQEET
ncbi:ketopantoate reductase family protein [Candidatus Omnitrophota bacterium]